MMLLLDTHAFLWFIAGSRELGGTARSLIEDPNNVPLLSVASLREMAIKVSLGRLSLGQAFDTLIPEQLALNGIDLLPIKLEHTSAVASLPYRGHRDPFDRMLAAQAAVEGLPIVSRDSAFEMYRIQRLW